MGGVAGPCGLIRVSWGLRGLRSCPHQGSGTGGLRPRSLGGNLQILQQACSSSNTAVFKKNVHRQKLYTIFWYIKLCKPKCLFKKSHLRPGQDTAVLESCSASIFT